MYEYFKMTVNGYDQQILISGDDTKPLLLFCHGGPGTPTMSMLKKWSKPLFEDFLVVTWDQRGTGRSFTKDLDIGTININTIVKDTHEITAYLKNRFNREKIFIMGHSFGATLAMQVIKERPGDYLAYFAISQFVNTRKNEQLCYEFVLDQAKKLGHDNIVKKLEKIGPPVDGYYKQLLKDLVYVKKLVGKYKGDNTMGNANMAVLKNLFLSKEYGRLRLANTIKGITVSLEKVGKSLSGIAYDKTHTKLDLPVYFFSGDYDQLTPQSILRDYFREIDAPYKELHLFHKSAHSPLWEESDKFHDIVRNILVGYTNHPTYSA